MLVKEKRRRISPSPHMANYIKQIFFVYAAICFMVWVFYILSQVVLTSSYLVDRTEAYIERKNFVC